MSIYVEAFDLVVPVPSDGDRGLFLPCRTRLSNAEVRLRLVDPPLELVRNHIATPTPFKNETAMLDIVVSPGDKNRYVQIAKRSTALLVRGVLERDRAGINLIADRLGQLTLQPVGPAA